ncbi:MAG TPA: alpha/beta hydrolase-fold protein [Pirellulaceae bacterium]
MAVLLSLALLAPVFEEAPVISPGSESDGILIHGVESPFQEGTTQIRVLLPDAREPNRKYPVVFVLPVEAKNESRYGDGLAEIKKHDLHNKHHAIFVSPTFSHLPWYADHPTDPFIRQETYFLHVVVPFVERTYPIEARPEGRLLLGFSKSGWGAWSLLLRHPDIFGRAAAWDAPLMMDRLGKYGTTPIFGTQVNFEAYRLTDLLETNRELLGSQKRFVLTGYGNFRPEHEQMHALLDKLNIAHEYRDGPLRKHDWHSGWVPEAVELLLARHAAE